MVVVDGAIAGSNSRVIYPLPLQLKHNMGGLMNAIAYDRCGAGEKQSGYPSNGTGPG